MEALPSVPTLISLIISGGFPGALLPAEMLGWPGGHRQLLHALHWFGQKKQNAESRAAFEISLLMIHSHRLCLLKLLRYTSVLLTISHFLFAVVRKWVHSLYAQMRKLETRMLTEGSGSHTANEERR